jgi:hypothetical protein
MMLPASGERGIVVFKLWPSLYYNTRLFVSFTLIAVGLAFQMISGSLIAGLVLIALGNLFLLVSGYDNRVDFDNYDPTAEWERAELDKLDELIRLDRKIRRWDRSILDVTNWLGASMFILLAVVVALTALLFRGLPRILAIDAAVLFLPHWLTGIRRVLTQPKLVTKAVTIRHILDTTKDHLRDHHVDLMTLLKGADAKLPDDVKFKVDIKDHHPDFLGLYGQVVLNEVQGSSYPYFYVVLVARQGFGLPDARQNYRVPEGITSELKYQGEVEVLVIRQRTTKKSGYHTKPNIAVKIFLEGLRLAEQVAGSPKK